MTLVEAKGGGRQRGSFKKDKVKPPTKLIIRHLPPTMTEEEFLKQVELPEHDFYYFVPADWSLGFEATCRAYFNVKQFDDVYMFRDRFDGYVFVDSKGVEFEAIVEFAPFQGMLKNKSRRTDNKVGTIEDESHYQQFLAKMEEDCEAAEKCGEHNLEFTLDRKQEEKITSTPLLQYLANKKEKRREEAKKRLEEKRRQREEERRRQREVITTRQTAVQTAQKSKTTNAHEENSGGKQDGRRDDAVNSADVARDERKNSRSKRRAERDQRRREEHEQRKKDRERLEREQTDVGGSVEKGIKETTTVEPALVEEIKPKADSDGGKPKRDGNRRNRNRKVSGENASIKSQSFKASSSEKARNSVKTQKISILKVERNNAAVNEEAENDNVRSFIRSVVNAKEFVPKSKQEDLSTAVKDSESDGRATNAAVEKRITQPDEAINAKEEADERKLEIQRSIEERRIRNKNRPSIAIYQPKPRTQRSEESDSFVGSTQQECEKTFFDNEQQRPVKKISRYSERRERRAYRERQKAKEISEGDQTKMCEKDVVGETEKGFSDERIELISEG